MKKIIFVFNSPYDTRCCKRVEEFIDNGYDVEVYAFDRGVKMKDIEKRFIVNIVGHHDISMNYFQRFFVIYRSLKKLFRKYKHEDVLFFLFFFDVASIGHILCKKPYIYELSDMPYMNIRNSLARYICEYIDRHIIRKSLLTTMTSEGFVDFFWGGKQPNNVVVVPNRVDERMDNFIYTRQPFDINHLRFSFIGGFRYLTTLNFIRIAADSFPQHTFSIYGNIIQYADEIKAIVNSHSNVYAYGTFKYPDEMPDIYSKTDIVLSNYNAKNLNAQYAEPNKMYEAIYFCTPIVVSRDTFLANKVSRLDIGFQVNSDEKNDVIDFVKGLTEDILSEKIENCMKIPHEDVINKNPLLFKKLNEMIILL